MKILMMIILILFCSLSYSQTSFKFDTLGTKVSFLEYCKKTQSEKIVNPYILEKPRPKHKEPNNLLVPATVGYFAFAGILTLNHFSNEKNYKKSEGGNNLEYVCLLSGLTITYVLIISIN